MPENAVQASIATPAPSEQRSGAALGSSISRYPWLITCAGIIVLSALLILWARTRPGYDPYGWLVWGYQTLHLSLDLGGAPSWKPLPYLFTVPYALFGHFELWLWMVTAVSVTVVGYASVLAWVTHLDVGSVGFIPELEKRRHYPIVLVLPVPPGGWSVQPWHTRRRMRGECLNLRAAYIITKRNPSGALIRG